MDEERQELDFAEREVVLRANLDDLDDDSCIQTPVRFLMSGPRHPQVGESVFLIDRKGRGCMGEVVEINGWMARVRPDLAPGS